MTESPTRHIPAPPIAVIIAAAGSGERMGGTTPKAWRKLGGITLLEHAWRSFLPDSMQEHNQAWNTAQIVIAVPTDLTQEARTLTTASPVPVTIVAGGKTRTDSVGNCLDLIPPGIQLIAVHDAARPFWPVGQWDELALDAWKWDGAILAVPVADTLKRANPAGMETVDRSDLWAAQTPQVFRADPLRRAHRHAREHGIHATDDADLVRRIGGAVKFVLSTPHNFKLTTPKDWDMAEKMVTAQSPARVGHGYDTHRLGGENPLVLGGVTLAPSGGLIGHSDGDALLHAVCDALLGAAALGDIGKHFPPSDPKFKGCDSRGLLKTVRELIDARGFIPLQVDVTVLAERPKIAPHADTIRANIAADLGIGIDDVSVKATTNEGMGHIGRGEGIAVHAVATIHRRPGSSA